MHTKYTKTVLFIAGLAALTSCSTAYKMGQTPDDVYYSPAKPQSAYVSREERDNGDSYYEANPRRRSTAPQYDQSYNNPYYSGYDMYRNDRFLRMGIANRYRWNGYNDYLMYDGFYNYNRFSIFNDFYFSSPYNSFSYWNSFYNPYTSFSYSSLPYSYYGYGYGTPVIIGGGSKYPVTNIQPAARPRAFNPAGYGNSFSNNNRYLNTNAYSTTPSNNTNSGRYNNSNSRYNNSNSYYNNSNNNRTNTYRTESNNSFFNNNNSSSNNSSRAYTPSSSGNSGGGSSSSGSSGGGGVSRPTRGGN